jgi:hypothetical protein
MQNKHDSSDDITYFLSKIEWPIPNSGLAHRIIANSLNQNAISEQEAIQGFLFRSPLLIAFAFMMAIFLGTMSASVGTREAVAMDAMDSYMSASYNSSLYPVACAYVQNCNKNLDGGFNE